MYVLLTSDVICHDAPLLTFPSRGHAMNYARVNCKGWYKVEEVYPEVRDMCVDGMGEDRLD